METVCSSANGEWDTKSETLVDGFADFRDIFIYSEREITPLNLFMALESFEFCNLLVALGGLQNHCSQNTHAKISASVANVSCFTCYGSYNFMEKGSRE